MPKPTRRELEEEMAALQEELEDERFYRRTLEAKLLRAYDALVVRLLEEDERPRDG